MMAPQRMISVFLTVAVAAKALQMSKDGGGDLWNPLDYFSSSSEELLAGGDMKPYVHPEGNRSKPRMLLSSGCDAASGIMKHAHSILELHGIHTPKYEMHTLHDNVENLLNATDSRVLIEAGQGLDLGCDESCRAMIQAHKYYAGQNASLVFKAILGADQDAILSKSIMQIGTLIALTSRRNKLDQLVCMVRDCYEGYGVHDLGRPEQNGQESKICWKRRQMKPAGYKANLKVAKMQENMLNIDAKVESTIKSLKEMGYPWVEAVVSEELLDFEWNKAAAGPGVKAWSSLLAAWGVHPQADKIKAYLDTNAGTEKAPGSHKETIVNFAEVKEFLQNHPRFSFMLRE